MNLSLVQGYVGTVHTLEGIHMVPPTRYAFGERMQFTSKNDCIQSAPVFGSLSYQFSGARTAEEFFMVGIYVPTT